MQIAYPLVLLVVIAWIIGMFRLLQSRNPWRRKAGFFMLFVLMSFFMEIGHRIFGR